MDINIKEMRQKEKLSQSQFASKYEIPLRTLQEWEQGRRCPPDYTVKMIARLMKYEELVEQLKKNPNGRNQYEE